MVPRPQWPAGLRHQRLGCCLAAHGLNRCGRRTNKDQALIGAGTGECGILREKAIAGMNGLGATGSGGRQNQISAEIAVTRFGAAQIDGPVRFAHMQRIGVYVAMHRDRFYAELACGAHDPAGNFAAVGNQQACDHGYSHQSESVPALTVCQAGGRFCRKAFKPSWPSGLTRVRAMAASV